MKTSFHWLSVSGSMLLTAIIFTLGLTLSAQTVTDIDGNVYNTVNIGTQVWMQENLKTIKYNDGTDIPLVTDNIAWSELLTPGYSWYNNDEGTYKAEYGALYNWYAVNTGKLCPTGWHVPTVAEWDILINFLGGSASASYKLKEAGTTHWNDPNIGATNESGFTALPGGMRIGGVENYYGTYNSNKEYGYWWSSTEYQSDYAHCRILYYNIDAIGSGAGYKDDGFSVRCLKDFDSFSGVIKKATIAPVIDGSVDVVWADANTYSIDQPFIGETPTLGASGETAWKALWTDEGIYILVEVNDDVFSPVYAGTEPASYWLYDKPEIYFDVNEILLDGGGPTPDGTGNGNGHYHISPSPIESEIGGGTALTEGAIGATYAFQVLNPSYRVEYFIPFSMLLDKDGNQVSRNATIGFDVTVIDNDVYAPIRNRAVWANTGTINESWANMDGCGTFVLEGAEPEIPVTSISISTPGDVSSITTEAGTLQMMATVLPADATVQEIDWKVTDSTGRASIDASGLLTAKVNGTVTVIATSMDGSNITESREIIISNQIVTIQDLTIIKDGGFSNEGVIQSLPITDQWDHWSGNGGMASVVEGICTMIPAAVSDPWQLQVYQAGWEVYNDTTYRITFTAWADANRVFQFSLEDPLNNYWRLGSSADAGSVSGRSEWVFNLTTEPKTYTFHTTIDSYLPNTQCKLVLMASGAADIVYIDNISIVSENDFALITEESGGDSTITDVEGNVYKVVTIGTQSWMAENLKTTKYNDGTDIPLVTDNTAWSELLTPGYSWYNNDEATYKAEYGALYNWYAVNTGKLCPTGWHVPTHAEWTVLTDFLGGNTIAGGKLKEAGLTHWNTPNTDATNESGFTALPGGRRSNTDGSFYNTIGYGFWWTATENGSLYAWYRDMAYNGSGVGNGWDTRDFGFSVRCIEDTPAVIPTLTTSEVSAIAATTATTGGNISSDGGAAVTERGVCYNTTPEPTISNSIVTGGTGTGLFVSELSGLTAGTTYYVRAYATNSVGTAYGNEINFTTLPSSNIQTITTCFDPFFDSGGQFGNYSDNENKTWVFYPENPGSKLRVRINSMYTEEGYDLLHIYDGEDTLAQEFPGSPFSGSYSNLTFTASDLNTAGALTFQFISDVSVNEFGWNAEILCSENDTAVKVNTWYTWNITSTTAELGGEIICGDSGRILSRGVCWSTDPDPDMNDQFTWEPSGIGDFTQVVSGLTPNTIYFVKVYAITESDTLYGNELSFSTFWEGYYQEKYSSELSYFHPTAGGSYPNDPYGGVRIAEKSLSFIEEGKGETWFGIWDTEKCWITINPDNSISYEVSETWPYEVLLGDPNDPSKISHFDPVDGKIYLYYHYWGSTGYRIFWEVLTPPVPPQAPYSIGLSNKYMPFSVREATVISWIWGRDYNEEDTLNLQLVEGFGDNHLFGITDGKLFLASNINLGSPKEFDLKIRVTDNTGLSAEFETVIHANTGLYEIQTLDFDETAQYIDEISVINNDVVWVQDRSGQVGRTLDGGESWEVIPLPQIDAEYGPFVAIDSLTMWLVASVGELGVYKTSDGGVTWEKQTSAYPGGVFPDIIHFWNKEDGFTLGDARDGYLEIYTTSDGGDNWTRVPSEDIPSEVQSTVNTHMVLSVVRDTVWVSCSPGYILRSTDRGYTWDAFNSPVNNLGSIRFINGQEGIFSPFLQGAKSMYLTNNGGETWEELITNVNPAGYYQKFCVLPGTEVLLMADNQTVYFSEDKGETWIRNSFDHPYLDGIDAYDSEYFWGGGEHNQVYKFFLEEKFHCKAEFSINLDTITGQAQFLSTSVNASGYYWDFGDGNYSTEVNPSNTFTQAGSYQVCLTIFNYATGCQSVLCKEVVYHPAGEEILIADFSYTSNPSDNSVIFTDLSTSNATSWYWTTGDGKVLNIKNPVYTYSKPGVYQVCLIVFDNTSGLTNSVCKDVTVGETPCNLVSRFSYFINPQTLEVIFTGIPQGEVTDYFWIFGDGSSSAQQSPVKTYVNPGYYQVSLAVMNNSNRCMDISSEFIQVGSAGCRADFSYRVDAASPKVYYYDNSKGEIDYYFWEFGDGGFSTEQNPEHTFKRAGIFLTGQTVIDNTGNCIDLIIQPVQTGEVDCSADFVSYIDSASFTGYFTNKVMGESTALLWSFGDGRLSTEPDPVHVFPGSGLYSVGLNTYDFNSGCMDFYMEMVLIGGLGIDCQSDFVYVVNPENPEVIFKNRSVGDITGSVWNFGDGTANSTDADPVHTYVKGGYYNVCLLVTNRSGIRNMNCKWVLVAGSDENDCRADFMFTIDSANLEVSFADRSLGNVDKYTWDFGDSKADSVSSLQNPDHTYNKKGYYMVRLTAENTATGCKSDEYKLLNVAESQVLKAAFDYTALDPDKKIAGYPIDLVSASSGDGATIEWDFGDKQIKKDGGFTVMDSTSRRVTHYYEKPGKYNVCVRISDPVSNQSDTYCQWVYTKDIVGIEPDYADEMELTVYPNPFIDCTTISYLLPSTQFVEIAIFDQLGRPVETIVRAKQENGKYRIDWLTQSLATGIYHLKFVTEKGVITKQLVISK